MRIMIRIIILLCLINITMFYKLAAAQETGIEKPYSPLQLFDDRIRITGTIDHIAKLRLHTPREDRWARKSPLNVFRTNVSLEGEYFMVRKPTWELNFVTHLYFSYDFMDAIDSKYRRAMPKYTKHLFKYTKDEDIVRELYFQYIRGAWDLRIGKQQVIWGEQLGLRTLDVINPLDIRTEVIGLTEWENIRIGVWMFRGIYDFADDLPGQLSLETVILPGRFEPAQIPREGSFFGPLFHPDRIPRNGYLDRLISYRYYKDAHLDGIKYAEWGLRLRGYASNFDLDWSVVYFHTIDDGGVWADGGKGGDLSAEFFTAYNIARTTNSPPRGRLFDFKSYDIYGFSLQRYFYSMDAILRLEAIYEDNRSYNKMDTDSKGMTRRDVVEKDAIGWGFLVSKKLPWPKWVPYLYDWSRGKYIDFDIALNQLIWRDYDEAFGNGDPINGTGYRLNGQPHGKGDNPVTTLSWMTLLHFIDDRIIGITRGTYYLNSPSLSFSVGLSYKPGEHWSFGVTANQYMSKRETDPYNGTESKDDVTLKVSFIF